MYPPTKHCGAYRREDDGSGIQFGQYFYGRPHLSGAGDTVRVRFAVNGGVASVYGANLEEVTDVELWKGEVGAGTLVATVPAAWDVDNSCLNTDPIDEEGLAEQGGYLRVATDGGADTYPVSYYA